MPEARFSFNSVARFLPTYQSMTRGDPLIKLLPQLLNLNPQTCIARLRDGKKALMSGMVTLPHLNLPALLEVWPSYQMREDAPHVLISKRTSSVPHIIPEDHLLTVNNPTEREYLALCILRNGSRIPAPIRLTNLNPNLITITTDTDTILQDQPDGSHFLF